MHETLQSLPEDRPDLSMDMNAPNGDVRGKPDKNIAKLKIPVPGNAEEQSKQQGGGATPHNQK